MGLTAQECELIIGGKTLQTEKSKHISLVSSRPTHASASPPHTGFVIKMVASVVQDKLAACLRPYEAVLGRRARMWRLESFLWIRGSPIGDVDEDRTLMEALELFVLLARADWRLWMNAVTKMGLSLSNGVQLDEEAPEEVGVSLERSTRWSRDLCEFLVTSSKNTTSSVAFHASRKLMLRACSGRRKTIDEVGVRIGCVGGERLEVQLADISQLISRQQRACREAQQAADVGSLPTEPFYCGLRFREVEIVQMDRLANVTLLGYAGEIASCGVILTYLSPALVEVQKQHPHEFMDAMVKIFPLLDPSEAGRVSGVRCLSIPGFSIVDAYPAFLSAVRASFGVRKIDFTPYFDAAVTTEQKRWLWSWLACGVFSKPRGKHNIQEITLHTGGLYKKTVESITRILQGVNPVATLFNVEGDDVPPETVSASEFALLDPSSPEGSLAAKWICDHPLDDLPVIDRTGDRVSVLLPRWGQAWVHRDDVLSCQTRVATTPQIQSIPRVILVDIEEASQGPVVTLLRMIGHGIRHLEVSSRSFVDWGYLAREMLEACPDMESLKLQGNEIKLTTLRCILDACASGSRRLQRLHLESVNLTGRCRSLLPLMEALSSRQHPAGRYLKEVTLSCMPFSTMLTPSDVLACVAMLKENVILQRFKMSFHVQHRHRTQFVDFLAQLKLFDGERIEGMRNPTTLGFLSVVAGEHGQEKPPRTFRKLDAHVVSMILAFVGSSFIRRVTILM